MACSRHGKIKKKQSTQNLLTSALRVFISTWTMPCRCLCKCPMKESIAEWSLT